MHVLVADEHTIARKGLRDLLIQHYSGVTVSECTSIRGTAATLASRTTDLVILDLLLSDGNAFDHLASWHAGHASTRFLIYSVLPEHLFAQRVVALGCSGFLPKAASEEELLSAVDHVMSGGIHMRHAPVTGGRSKLPFESTASPFTRLSDRELRVLQELLAGTSIKDIARQLLLSPSTVATYKARVYDKLGVANEMELRRAAEINGFRFP